jgi:beta-glucosidase
MDEPLKDYEKAHIKVLKETASECTLFLKSNGEFPIEKPCKVLLVGPGAREHVKEVQDQDGLNLDF